MVWVDFDDGHAGGYPHECDEPPPVSLQAQIVEALSNKDTIPAEAVLVALGRMVVHAEFPREGGWSDGYRAAISDFLTEFWTI